MDTNKGIGSPGDEFSQLNLLNFSQNGPPKYSGGDDVLPSYDFHPRSNGHNSGGGGGTSNPRFEDITRQASPPSSNYTPPRDPPMTEAARPRQERDKEAYDSAIIAAVERTMKKNADRLLTFLGEMSSRISNLETTTQRLEQSFEKSRMASANSLGQVDGEVRKLNNMVLEVQRGVQILRDKQEISEAQYQLKLQQESKAAAAAAAEVVKVEAKPTVAASHAPAPVPPVHPTDQSQAVLPPVQQAQQQFYTPPAPAPAAPVQAAGPPNVQFGHQPPLAPLAQQQTPPPLALAQQPLPQHQQQQVPQHQQQQHASLLPQQQVAHQHPPLHGHQHQPEAPPYPPQLPAIAAPGAGVNYDMQSYFVPHQQQRPVQQQQQQQQPQYIQAGHPNMYEQGRTASGQLTLPAPPSYMGQQQQQYDPSPPPSYGGYRVGSGGGGYPHLPTAQALQPSRTSNRPPSRSGIEDVIDQVVSMGFNREHVRATVQRLTNSGQPVDPNTVVDALTNGGSGGSSSGDSEPPKSGGWFNR